jgi:hypothetical protein
MNRGIDYIQKTLLAGFFVQNIIPSSMISRIHFSSAIDDAMAWGVFALDEARDGSYSYSPTRFDKPRASHYASMYAIYS